MTTNKNIGQSESPEASQTPGADHVDKTNTDIRCTCRRLLAKRTSDGAGIEVQCPRCKRTWTFKLGPL